LPDCAKKVKALLFEDVWKRLLTILKPASSMTVGRVVVFYKKIPNHIVEIMRLV
jgi:hypothetical protein